MFNLAVYGIVDKVLQTHILRSVLAMSLDMNDFMHVELVYLPQSASGSGPALCSASKLLPTLDAPHVEDHPTPARTIRSPSACPVVPPSTERGTGAEDFNVGEFLVNRNFPVSLFVETRIDQYGLMFEHVMIHQRDSSDKDNTPPNPNAGYQRPSARVSPARQPSPMDEDEESDRKSNRKSDEDLDV